ncbi:CD225/dispanin family protein [Myroides fluvii]|uniref:CD225/dispanin family protein n=1 Tax=Myroides fluvii TaxID=2572594 RepID=UPI00131C2E0C|nr:CD225/dispanin family protein [Myroides fluvii]
MDQNRFNQQFDTAVNQAHNQKPEKPNSYIALSIVSTILGFCTCLGLILGIVAIVMSAQSGQKYERGDYQGAIRAAKTAKILSFVVLGMVVLSIIYIWIGIQQVGGWDAYKEIIEEAYRQGQAAGM